MHPNSLQLDLPKLSNDKVIGVIEGSKLVLPNSTDRITIDTGTAETTLLEGIYTIDSDPQYVSLVATYFVNDDISKDIFMVAYSQPNSLVLYFNNLDDSVQHFFNYHIALIAKTGQTEVSLLSLSYQTLLTSQTNYRKILKEDVVPLFVPGTNTSNTAGVVSLVVSHDLNYYPTIRYSIEYDDKIGPIFFTAVLPIDPFFLYSNVIVGKKDITFKFSNDAGSGLGYNLKLHYRIYYDEH